MFNEEVGKIIRNRRKKLNLTQSQLAEKLSVSDKSISKWENGICKPDMSLISDLCDILQIDISELIYAKETIKRIDSNEISDEFIGDNVVDENRNIKFFVYFGVTIVLILVIYVLFIHRVALELVFEILFFLFLTLIIFVKFSDKVKK